MFEHWLQFAPTLAPRLELDADTIIRAHEIVRCIMGDNWLGEQERARANPARSSADIHPLDLALRSSTEDSVLEVLQLAAYFCAFQTDRGLGEAIVSLRDTDKYYPTIVELDLAWKFRSAGGSVALAPATPSGRSDFSVVVDDIAHIVEVTSFPSDPLRGAVASFSNAMASTLGRTLRKAGLATVVAVEIDVPAVSGAIRSAADSAVREAVNLFAAANDLRRIERTYDFGAVAIRPAVRGERPHGGTYWTTVSRIGTAQLSEAKLFGETDYKITRGGSLLYLRDQSLAADPYVRLKQKLKDKSRQLRGCTDGVIMIEAEALGPDVFNDVARLEQLVDEFARNHKRTTAVAIILQPIKLNGTRGIGGHYFALSPGALSRRFWDLVVEEDNRATVLQELKAIARV